MSDCLFYDTWLGTFVIAIYPIFYFTILVRGLLYLEKPIFNLMTLAGGDRETAKLPTVSFAPYVFRCYYYSVVTLSPIWFYGSMRTCLFFNIRIEVNKHTVIFGVQFVIPHFFIFINFIVFFTIFHYS